MREPDAAFADPRMAALYDVLDDDRSDLEVYRALVDELGAQSVIDIGCGTGSFAVMLASLGVRVIGVDPAAASVEVARTKEHAGGVRWVEGDATALNRLELAADLAVMTGNVAQVFVSDEDWRDTLASVGSALRPQGWFVFETRRIDARAWEEWDVIPTPVDLPGGDVAVVSRQVIEIDWPHVSFVGRVEVGGETLTSTSTLRFRGRDEVERDLSEHGFDVVEVRDAPDRPGKEWVFLARRR